MSTTTIQAIYKVGGVLTDPDSNEVFLSDSAAAYGVKRTDTDAVVVADNTQMTRISTGVYQHSFTDPAYDLTYQYATEAVISGNTFREVLYKDGTTTPGTAGTTLLSVRKTFVKITGRYDLVVDTTDWVDNGANAYINEGQRFLDRSLDHQKTLAKHIAALAADGYKVGTTNIMALNQVWVQETSSDEQVELQYVDWDAFRELYPLGIANTDSGTSAHWTWAINRQSPENNSNVASDYTSASLLDYEELDFGDHWAKDSILVGPPTDTAATIILVGKFYSPTLTNDGDVTYWSARHPNLLARAGAFIVEGNHRNTSGAEDFLNTIKLDLQGIDREMAEWELNSLDSGYHSMKMWA